MKNLTKGGFVSLLSCLLSLSPVWGQEGFIKKIDPQLPEYGTILSPELQDSIIDGLVLRDLTFPEWSSFFSINTSGSSRSVLGRYRINKNRVSFQPRFLPDSELTYQISFDFNALYLLLDPADSTIDRPPLIDSVQYMALNDTKTFVKSSYPLTNTLPANALRLYIYFSQPMGFSNPYDYISLVDFEGTLVKNAFVELPEGLWNEDRTRLTLLFHPGRVKQGVGPNVKEGSVLKEGNLYELVIGQDWKDANGKELEQEYSRKIFVTGTRRNKLKAKNWQIESICQKECLFSLATIGNIDIEMFDKMVSIRGAKDEEVDYSVYPESDGTLLIRSDEFKKGGTYKVVVNPKMEDMCGNTFLNAFDYEEGTRKRGGKPVEILVEIE